MIPQPPETPKKQKTISGRVTKTNSSRPNSSRSGTSTGRQLRYGHCPTCKLGILERRRNNPDGKGPDAGLWRLSCTRYSAVPPCKHYEAFHEDPAIIWQRKQNQMGKGPCPECNIGKLVERIKNPFDFTEKYAECSRRGEEGGGCNYRRLMTKGKAEAVQQDIEMANVNDKNQDVGDSNLASNNDNTNAEGVGRPENKNGVVETPQAAALSEPATEDARELKTSDTLDTPTATVSPKGKAKITIDLTLDDDEGDARYGSVSACYPAPASAVYPAQTRLFRSSASPRNSQGMPPPKKPTPQPSALRKTTATIQSNYSNTLVTPEKSPMVAGQSQFSGRKLMPAARIHGLPNTPVKPPSTGGQQHSTRGMITPVTNRSSRTFPVPAAVPKKRPREEEEEEFDEFGDLDSDVKTAMIALAESIEKPSASNNNINRNQTRNQVNNRLSTQVNHQVNNRFNSYTNPQVQNQFNRRPSNTQFKHQSSNHSTNQLNNTTSNPLSNPVPTNKNNHNNNQSDVWASYQANSQSNSQFINNNTNPFPNNINHRTTPNITRPLGKQNQQQDEFDDLDEDDDLEFMALAEQTERQIFGDKRY
ncbi:hypothetical protein B0T21DRAFT_383467 [Apiosordaria backusii]|uniref:Uncharacterized protein n=1 Tax=Apiosordaria backusii TaxID=314023 RepID=A0AA40BNS6_9PEZI|nr:hypothetical protein B0T21DRAFT_383467 [Apiosordaria backusii]